MDSEHIYTLQEIDMKGFFKTIRKLEREFITTVQVDDMKVTGKIISNMEVAKYFIVMGIF